ncbi:MAG: methyltransferase domain-containing protein, partial [Gaiellales bacterium]
MNVQELVAQLDEAGVEVLLPDGPEPGPGREVPMLVPRNRWAAARQVFEGASWRHALGDRGLWRLTGTVSYGWDDGTVVNLHRGVPAAPLPARALNRLERRLWSGAKRTEGVWFEPDDESRVVFLAAQAARPGFSFDRQSWDIRFGRALAAARAERLWAIADDTGLAGVLTRQAVPPAGYRMRRRTRWNWRGATWSGACMLQARIRPRRLATPLKTMLGGTPLLDRAGARCRFGGVDLVAGPRVFKPRGISEALAAATSDHLSDRPSPMVIEVGTGSGAVALAIAAARPDAEIHAVEIARRALRSARRNRRRLGARRVHFHRGSLLDPVPRRLHHSVDAVVANVPYVPPDRRNWTWQDAPGAVAGRDPDGLGLVRDVVQRATEFLKPGGRLVLQMTATQWEQLTPELIGQG